MLSDHVEAHFQQDAPADAPAEHTATAANGFHLKPCLRGCGAMLAAADMNSHILAHQCVFDIMS